MIWEGKVQTPFAVVQRAKKGFREWKTLVLHVLILLIILN